MGTQELVPIASSLTELGAMHRGVPRSLALVKSKGITNGEEFINLMRCLILDVIEDNINDDKASLICNIAGKMLRAIEMQYK